jgi:hypothetical protein
MASSMYGTSSRFTMNPALSRVGMPIFPSFAANCFPVSKVSSDVVTSG